MEINSENDVIITELKPVEKAQFYQAMDEIFKQNKADNIAGYSMDNRYYILNHDKYSKVFDICKKYHVDKILGYKIIWG